MDRGQRVCSLCSKALPEDKFYTNGKTASGRSRHRSWCKQCEKKRVTKHRKSNPYLYDKIECLDCSDTVNIRLSKEPGILVYVCKPCAITRQQNPSEKGNQEEAYNASNKEST